MKMKIKVKNAYPVFLRSFKDKRGRLFVGEFKKDLPFSIKRIFFIDSFKKNLKRACHAHNKNEEIIFCIRGSLTIHLDDGFKRQKIVMKDPLRGIYLGPDLWREISNFSKDCLLLAISSRVYDEKDYIFDYNDFLKIAKKKNKK